MGEIRVMLVEDEEDFRVPLARYLAKVGMAVAGVGSAEEMAAELPSFQPNIVVLDVNLPGESGFAALERLRSSSSVGVVMLTARGGVDDRIQGLTLGADSYLAKPVNLKELELTIRNLFARQVPPTPPEPQAWTLDDDRWSLISPDGAAVRLSSAERLAVGVLLAQGGEPVDRETLSAAAGVKFDLDGGNDRNVDILISRLRRRFASIGAGLPIRSVRNRGYAFVGLINRKAENRAGLVCLDRESASISGALR